jgi:hypothetical protein
MLILGDELAPSHVRGFILSITSKEMEYGDARH